MRVTRTGAAGGQRAVEGGGVGGDAAVRADQRVRGQGLAAVGGDEDLALGDHRGGEIEQERGLAWLHGHADADGVGGERTVGASDPRVD